MSASPRGGCRLSGLALRAAALALAALAVTLAAAIVPRHAAAADAAAPALRVGCERDFKPYAFVDEQGRPAGFGVDLIRAVADTMGLRITIVTGTWDTVWNDLVARKLDLLPVVARLPSRLEQVDFSLPHTETFDAFFVRRGTHAPTDLRSAEGKEIVVLRSDASHHALLERRFKGTVIPVDSVAEMFGLIASGKHDALLYPKLLGTLEIKERGLEGTLSAGPPIPDYQRRFCFAVKKGDAELLEGLNEGLRIVKTNGTYDRIYEKWLAADDPWRRYRAYLRPAAAVALGLFLAAGVWLAMLRSLVAKRTRELGEKNAALQRAGEELDERIRQRTAELVQANTELQTEVGERKRAEEALRRAHDELELRVVERTKEVTEASATLHAERQRFYDVLETLPVMICLLTPDHRVSFANRSFRERFGESRGRRCFEYCFGKAAPCEFCESFTVLSTGRPHHWEVSGPDGSVIAAHDFPFADSDGTALILEMDIDITEQRRAERALKELNETLEQRVAERAAEIKAANALLEQSRRAALNLMEDAVAARKRAEDVNLELRREVAERERAEESLRESNAELEAFVYSISHDLRGPVRSVSTFAKMLAARQGSLLDGQDQEYLGRIARSAEKMNRLIEDLLSLSQVARQEINRDDVDLSALAARIVAELREGEPWREVAVEIAPGLTVVADPGLMSVVLSNLLGNAWKFTARAPGARIRLGTVPRDDQRVYFVEDNGVGFDPTYAAQIFQPFHRLHSDAQFEGTGIGLAIVERIIRRHGGRVSATGEVGKGATLSFTL